jgi:hypothetical protein
VGHADQQVVRILMVTIAGLLCGGCFVYDEIEKGREIMEAHTPDSVKAARAVPELENGTGEAKDARGRLSAYYKKQRARASAPIKSDDPGDALGRCRVGSGTQFMRRSDCALRGGTFL